MMLMILKLKMTKMTSPMLLRVRAITRLLHRIKLVQVLLLLSQVTATNSITCPMEFKFQTKSCKIFVMHKMLGLSTNWTTKLIPTKRTRTLARK